MKKLAKRITPSLVVFITLLAGCAADGLPLTTVSRNDEMSDASTIRPPDFGASQIQDLAEKQDLVHEADLARTDDLAHAPDLLIVSDLGQVTDLAPTPDLMQTPDLAPPKLAVTIHVAGAGSLPTLANNNHEYLLTWRGDPHWNADGRFRRRKGYGIYNLQPVRE